MIAGRTKDRLWRFGSIVAFCGLPIVLIGAIASNVVDAVQASSQATQKRANTSMIVAQIERHRARKAAPVDAASLYLASTSDSLARAELEDRATKLAAQADGRLTEVQLVTTPEQEAQGTVAIQLTLSIDNKGLLDLLYAVESGLPLLDVTRLSAQRADGRSEGQDNVASPLNVQMTVQAHWRKAPG